MKKLIPLKSNFLILLLLLVVCSCDKEKKDQDNMVDRFKLAIGTTWKYHRIVCFTDTVYLNDSIFTVSYDTLADYDIIVSADKIETINGLKTIQLSSHYHDGNNEHTDYQFYTSDEFGLKVIAYKVNGMIVLPKRNTANNMFPPVYSFFGCSEFMSSRNLKEDSLYYENPPATVFQYPFEINNSWLLRSNQYFDLWKKVIGVENVETKIGDFECFKIEYLWDPDIGAKLIEYVSEYAILKRELTMENVYYTNDYGEFVEAAYVLETYTIKEINLAGN